MEKSNAECIVKVVNGAVADVQIENGTIIIDGKEYPTGKNPESRPIIVLLNGNVDKMSVSYANSVTVDGDIDCLSVKDSGSATINGDIDSGSITVDRLTAKNVSGKIFCDEINANTVNGNVTGSVKNCEVNISGSVETMSDCKVYGAVEHCVNFNGVLIDRVVRCENFNGFAYARTGMDINCDGDMSGTAVMGTGGHINCKDVSGTIMAGTGMEICANNVTGVFLGGGRYVVGTSTDGGRGVEIKTVAPALKTIERALHKAAVAFDTVCNLKYSLSGYSDDYEMPPSDEALRKAKEAIEAISVGMK